MRTQRSFRILLARPSDVESHADTVKSVLDDVNDLCEPIGVKFEVFDWRENATPGLSSRVQSRINGQANEVDAIVAIIGSTLGTPTGESESGTVEEIERAIDGHPNSVFGVDSVMVFFKSISLSIDADLLAADAVKKYRDGLSERQVLYKPFDDDDQLRKALFRSIGLLVAKLLASDSADIDDSDRKVTSQEVDKPSGVVTDDELGIFDHSGEAEVLIEEATVASDRMRLALASFGEAVDKATALTNAAPGDAVAHRKIVTTVAEAMTTCASEIEASGGDMTGKFEEALNHVRAVLEIQISDLSAEAAAAEAKTVEKMTLELVPVFDDIIPQISLFRDSMSSMPRMARDLNMAKKRILNALAELIENLNRLRAENKSLYEYARAVSRGK